MSNIVPIMHVPDRPTMMWQTIASNVSDRAQAVDKDCLFPGADIADLAKIGLLRTILPRSVGGDDICANTSVLCALLTAIGRESLTVGRLFEGHVNAATLASRYGERDHIKAIADEADAGRISGVWNAEGQNPLKAVRIASGWQLDGEKIYCSGAGSIVRPVITAQTADGPLMMLVDMRLQGITVQNEAWQPSGMRGTTTGSVVFNCVSISNAAVIGSPGDYYQSPFFAGGAWRILAVQLGGALRLIELHATHLDPVRQSDPVAYARLADAAGVVEASRLLVQEASLQTSQSDKPAEAIDAYVDLSRSTFERLILDAITLTQRNVGLRAMIFPSPIDRVLRDLQTYLRQPAIDASRDNAARWLIANNGRVKR